MFEAINNLWTAQAPRHAETADTRQEIQRHDPDQHRRKQNPREDNQDFDENGIAVISTQALKTFLTALAKARPQTAPRSPSPLDYKIQPELGFETPESPPPTPQNAQKNAYAAALYQNAAAIAENKNNVLLETTDTAAEEGPALDLSAADHRAIHALLADLDILIARNVDHLYLQRAPTFLQSLQNAIALQLSNSAP